MPSIAKISLVVNRQPLPSILIKEKWKEASSLLETDVSNRGWLADVLKCVEQQFSTFTLQDLYESSEEELQKKHPNNRNVRPKIRQQLQRLRDLMLVEFVKPGVYRFTKRTES
jgi:type II restriction enzyme